MSGELITHLLANLPAVFGSEIEYLREMGRTFKPDTKVLMLGMGSGQMALLMHEGAAEKYAELPPKLCEFHVVEWVDNSTYYIHMRSCGYDPGVVHLGTSWDLGHQFQDNYFDYIIVDACHWLTCVQKDIDVYWPKLVVGGKMFFHDYIAKETDTNVDGAIESRKNENWLEIARPGISIVYQKLG